MRAASSLTLVLILTLPPVASHPAEAMLRDGRRSTGELQHAPQRGLLFITPAHEATPLSQLHELRFDPAIVPASPSGTLVQVHFRSGEQLNAALLELDEQTLTVRSTWAGRRQIPRSTVAKLIHLVDHATVIHDSTQDEIRLH